MAKATVTKKETPVSREAFEAAIKDYISFNNEYTRLATQRDGRVAKIDGEYGTKFSDMRALMEEHFKTVQRYSQENREELFTEKKSMELFGAKIGFRLGPDKVSVITGFKLKDIVGRLLKLKSWKGYVRMKAELNKDALLAAKPKGMEKYGLTIEKEEAFYLEPYTTNVA